jgi:hypothetical protein
MPRKRPYTTRNAYRTIERIERKAEHRAEEIAQNIVDFIHINAPVDEHRRPDREGGPHLSESYYVVQDPDTGDFLVRTRRRYWAFVEFGTKKHGDAQPHIRPAIEAVRRYYR